MLLLIPFCVLRTAYVKYYRVCACGYTVHCTRSEDDYLVTLLTKITAAKNEVALSYHRLRGLYFLAVVFAATIVAKVPYISKAETLFA